jgi:2-dehydropantoate 2-reductase
MKILVYGAGVLGSTLAHVLIRAGNDVTLLARGSRLADLREKGLVIRHYVQMNTTTDYPTLVDRLDPADEYNLCFVIVQRQQLDGILPEIAASTGCRDFVLVGNNPTANETAEFIRHNSPVEKRVALGFQSSGGRREAGRVVSVYMGTGTTSGSMTLGSLPPDEDLYAKVRQAFTGTKYTLTVSADMDAWLKCHAAFIVPIVFACFYADGDLRKIAGDTKFLNRLLDAIGEAYDMVKAAGYPIMPPEDDGFLERGRSKTYWMLKLMAATPLGKLAASDHAMSAPAEMHRLYDDFCTIKEKAGIASPAWDELSEYMKKY